MGKFRSGLVTVANRRGTVTIEYVIVLVTAIFLATLLFLAIQNREVEGTIQQKIKDALSGRVVGLTENSSSPTPTKRQLDYSTFNKTAKYIRDEMVKNATGPDVEYMKQAPLPAQYAAWITLVRSGGPWDHKPILDKMFQMKERHDYYFPIPGDPDHEYFYDIYSNIHYAFVGRFAGFTEYELIKGSHVSEWFVGETDKSDDVCLQIGFELYNEYKDHPEDLTEDVIRQKILEHKDVFIEDGKAIPVTNGK